MSTVKNNQVQIIMPSLTYLLVILLRAAMLGLIVYYATSTIPSKAIDPKNKMIISLIVVVLYAIIDYFAGFFSTIRNLWCQATCGCSHPLLGGELDLPTARFLPANVSDMDTTDIAAEVDEAIRLLNAESEVKTNTKMQHDPLEEEESGALKATGLNETDKKTPAPAETTEGFSNYSSY